MEFMICCYGIGCHAEYWIIDHTYDPYDADITDVIDFATSALEELGGGHADIYDEDGNFVEDVEV